MFSIDELELEILDPIKRNKSRKFEKYLVMVKKGEDIRCKGNIPYCVKELKKEEENVNKIITPSVAFKCASGYYPIYYGYKWEFIEEKDKIENNIFYSKEAQEKLLNINKNHRRKIIAYSIEGKPIIGFKNIIEALVWIKTEQNETVDYRSIIFVAQNYNNPNPRKAKTSKGYVWRFYDDVNKTIK